MRAVINPDRARLVSRTMCLTAGGSREMRAGAAARATPTAHLRASQRRGCGEVELGVCQMIEVVRE